VKGSRVTLVLAVLTAVVLIVSVPGALREAYERGGFYLFSWAFLADIPRRLAGPGRFRFVMQPAVATLLGIRDGRGDARAGRPPYLLSLLVGGPDRREQLRSGFRSVVNLLLMGVLLDSVFQWVILGASYPGPALVVGPVLITTPYAVARALANRAARLRGQAVAGRPVSS
jgi:hypothetical protein